MGITTFEGLNNDVVCLILDKTLKPYPPGIDSETIARFACVSSRYANLVKERGWERACRNALPDVCEILLRGDKESPGDAGLIRNKSPFFLLSNYESGSCHVVQSTYTEWITQRATWNVWEAVPKAQRDVTFPLQDTNVAIAKVYRGMVADVSALAPGFAHKRGDKTICEDEPAALNVDRKAALKMPAAKQCPFCAKPMQRISSRFHSESFRDSFGAAYAEFHICSSGHVYGMSAVKVYPSRRTDASD
ncbi:hypothetical protein KFL_004690085 [Klebsormidium nitens]|uniref:Uncharacterized protein n=1 Tax=Klebsormidium nitens TaxID=105231 RepID=A0A1Y1IJK7_KLENI|nr:hypothetical protein KFL_004690085 [Klebsormidium nitens]|eukprot:GAQ88916.1 hypothetical protein KFL_004690085 [Klebsormidium nitens]